MKYALLLLLCSCASIKVYRIDRHEKIIEVSDSTTRNMQRLVILTKRKAELLGCKKIEFLELDAYHAKALCTEQE